MTRVIRYVCFYFCQAILQHFYIACKLGEEDEWIDLIIVPLPLTGLWGTTLGACTTRDLSVAFDLDVVFIREVPKSASVCESGTASTASDSPCVSCIPCRMERSQRNSCPAGQVQQPCRPCRCLSLDMFSGHCRCDDHRLRQAARRRVISSVAGTAPQAAARPANCASYMTTHPPRVLAWLAVHLAGSRLHRRPPPSRPPGCGWESQRARLPLWLTYAATRAAPAIACQLDCVCLSLVPSLLYSRQGRVECRSKPHPPSSSANNSASNQEHPTSSQQKIASMQIYTS